MTKGKADRKCSAWEKKTRAVEGIVLPLMARECPVGSEPEFLAGLIRMGFTKKAYFKPVLRGFRERKRLASQ